MLGKVNLANTVLGDSIRLRARGARFMAVPFLLLSCHQEPLTVPAKGNASERHRRLTCAQPSVVPPTCLGLGPKECIESIAKTAIVSREPTLRRCCQDQ